MSASLHLRHAFAFGMFRKDGWGEGDSYIYSLNTERTGLVKISYDIDQEDTLGAAESILEELKKPAEEIEYTPAIPDNVEVLGCSLKGSILGRRFQQ